MTSAIAIAAVEKLAPVIIAALAPEVQSLLKSIPAGLVKGSPLAAAICGDNEAAQATGCRGQPLPLPRRGSEPLAR